MNRMGLSDYAIAPIQRITRYCLLLKGNYSPPAKNESVYQQATRYRSLEAFITVSS